MSCRFGVRNEDRRRGLKLLMNGHLDPSTFELSRGMHAVTGHDVIAITCRCCASMRPKVYSCVCVFDAVTGVQLPAPDSKCDCVCGFECSHRFALGDLFVGFLQLLPTDTTYEQLCGYVPDSLTVIMSEPVPLDYIFGFEGDMWQNLKSMDYADVGVKGKRSKRFKKKHHRRNRVLPTAMRTLMVVHMATTPTSTTSTISTPTSTTSTISTPTSTTSTISTPTSTISTPTSTTSTTSTPPAQNGSQLVGSWIKLVWPEDGKWYRAQVMAFDGDTAEIKVEYEDGSEEFVDLSELEEGKDWVSDARSAESAVSTTAQQPAGVTAPHPSEVTAPQPADGTAAAPVPTCSYGDDCLYPSGMKFQMHLCHKCNVRSHAMCSHEVGHTGDKVLCKPCAVAYHTDAMRREESARRGRLVCLCVVYILHVYILHIHSPI